MALRFPAKKKPEPKPAVSRLPLGDETQPGNVPQDIYQMEMELSPAEVALLRKLSGAIERALDPSGGERASHRSRASRVNPKSLPRTRSGATGRASRRRSPARKRG